MEFWVDVMGLRIHRWNSYETTEVDNQMQRMLHAWRSLSRRLPNVILARVGGVVQLVVVYIFVYLFSLFYWVAMSCNLDEHSRGHDEKSRHVNASYKTWGPSRPVYSEYLPCTNFIAWTRNEEHIAFCAPALTSATCNRLRGRTNDEGPARPSHPLRV